MFPSDGKVYRKAWRLAHLDKEKAYNEKNADRIKAYNEAYRLTHREEAKKRAKAWALANPDRVREWHKKYREEHKLQAKAYMRKWQIEHPDRAYKWARNHPEHIKAHGKKYLQSPEGKLSGRKHRANRRQLGFVALNKPFSKSTGHHIDKERVIYMPRKLHQSIPHSVLKNINMDKINKLAYHFLAKQELSA